MRLNICAQAIYPTMIPNIKHDDLRLTDLENSLLRAGRR